MPSVAKMNNADLNETGLTNLTFAPGTLYSATCEPNST
jgi:hypothetical protein